MAIGDFRSDTGTATGICGQAVYATPAYGTSPGTIEWYPLYPNVISWTQPYQYMYGTATTFQPNYSEEIESLKKKVSCLEEIVKNLINALNESSNPNT